MYNIIYEMSRQSRFDARYWMLGAGALGWPRGMVWGERREEGSGWGTHVYLWQIHFDIWQNQYNIVKLNKIKKKKKAYRESFKKWAKYQWLFRQFLAAIYNTYTYTIQGCLNIENQSIWVTLLKMKKRKNKVYIFKNDFKKTTQQSRNRSEFLRLHLHSA